MAATTHPGNLLLPARARVQACLWGSVLALMAACAGPSGGGETGTGSSGTAASSAAASGSGAASSATSAVVASSAASAESRVSSSARASSAGLPSSASLPAASAASSGPPLSSSSSSSSGSGSGSGLASSTGGTELPTAEEPRLTADITAFAVPRVPGSPAWQTVQTACEVRLRDLGFTVERHTYATGVNVVGRREGPPNGGGAVLVSAHYDSVNNCPGADDNASGVAVMLEVARLLADAPLQRDLIMACWDEEERGLVGSRAWVAEASASGTQISMGFSLETLGYASSAPNSQTLPLGFDLFFPMQVAAINANDKRGDFIAWVGNPATADASMRFAARAADVGLPQMALVLTQSQTANAFLGDLRRSDHAALWEAGYPGVMLTDTANFRNSAYHCMGAQDSVDRLSMPFVAQVATALARTVGELLLE